MSLEELQDQVGEKLLDLSVEQLQRVATEIKVSFEKETKRHVLLRRINESIDTCIDEEDKDVAKCCLIKLLKIIKEMKQGQLAEPEEDEDSTELACL